MLDLDAEPTQYVSVLMGMGWGGWCVGSCQLALVQPTLVPTQPPNTSHQHCIVSHLLARGWRSTSQIGPPGSLADPTDGSLRSLPASQTSTTSISPTP